jgi:hypothetical protein
VYILTLKVFIHLCNHLRLIVILLIILLNNKIRLNSFDALNSEEQFLPTSEILFVASESEGDHLVTICVALLEMDTLSSFTITIQLHQVLIQCHF